MAQSLDMIARVIGLVGARRDAMADGPALGFQHRLGGAAFRPAIGRRDHARHRKPVPVLHGDMAEVAELCLAPVRLAVEAALGIGRARMRFVRALLFVPVRAVAIAGAVFRLEALLRRPGLDQGPIHRKMLVGQERLHLRMV